MWAEARDRAAGRPTAKTIRDVAKERQAPPAVDAKARQKAEIAQSYRNLSNTLNAIPPERIAEINESVKPAVEFGQLVSACRQFAEALSRIDLDYAARGVDTDKLPTVIDTFKLVRRVEQILGEPT